MNSALSKINVSRLFLKTFMYDVLHGIKGKVKIQIIDKMRQNAYLLFDVNCIF